MYRDYSYTTVLTCENEIDRGETFQAGVSVAALFATMRDGVVLPHKQALVQATSTRKNSKTLQRKTSRVDAHTCFR